MPIKPPFSDAEKARRRAYLKRWQQSPAGKAWLRAYRRTDKAKAVQKRHRQTDAWKQTQRRFRQTAKGKAVQRHKTAKRIATMRALIQAAKNTLCPDCGRQLEPRRMHFHHERGPNRFSPGHGILRTRRVVLEELAKCVVLCGSCHTRRHTAIRQWLSMLRVPLPPDHPWKPKP
jgi:hypothetical protein